METENAVYRKDFLSFKKKSKTKNQFYNNHFRKVVIFNSIPDALHDLHTSKYKKLAIDLTMVAYGNRPNANKSDLLRTLKHLMETMQVFFNQWVSTKSRITSNPYCFILLLILYDILLKVAQIVKVQF